MHAYLITGGGEKKQKTAALDLFTRRGVRDIITLETQTKHSIEAIRNLNKDLSIAPVFSGPRGVLIINADSLTDEAGNAFLKTLEEPPGEAVIVLTAPSKDQVLQTIASRAQNIDLGNNETQPLAENSDYLAGKTIGERLKLLDTISVREQALQFCVNQTIQLHKKLIKSSQTNPKETPSLLKFAKKLEQTKNDLEMNVNVKLALGDLLINV